jgi:hypothetical protein
MRSVPFSIVILFLVRTASAGEIREFDLKTIERLGNELTRVSQTRDRGATTPVHKRAKQTAMAALKGKLFDIHYDYVVLDDPDGSGFLVYALGKGLKPGDVVLAGHFRVTVSTNGEKAERVDALSLSLLVTDKDLDVPSGGQTVGPFATQLVSNKPLETFIYTSNLIRMPIIVATPPDGRIWFVGNGQITRDKDKPPSKPKR